jgi:hypothetical protein
MAHQLAGIISPDHHRPHGAAFREACRLLRADPAASAGYQVLDPLAASAASAPEDRLRLRVQKLFALAESPNPHEAASAMRKARELMTRYGVDATNRSWSGPHLSILIGAAALRHYRDDYLLAHLLTDLYEVAGVWVPAYVLTKGRMGSALEISGRPAQVQVAAYAHDFVRRFIEDGWRREPIRHKNGKRSRRDFAVGVIQGFRDRVIPSRSVKLADQTCLKALVPVPDSGLAAYLQHRYPRLRHFRREGACVDPDAYAAGLDRGRSMVIHQGVTDSATLPRALPERASMGARPSEEG